VLLHHGVFLVLCLLLGLWFAKDSCLASVVEGVLERVTASHEFKPRVLNIWASATEANSLSFDHESSSV
jgi:hypothetical protein